MGAPLTDTEIFISSKDAIRRLPDSDSPLPREVTGDSVDERHWVELVEGGPEDVLAAVADAALERMSPQEADRTIERGRAILASYKSRGKRP